MGKERDARPMMQFLEFRFSEEAQLEMMKNVCGMMYSAVNSLLDEGKWE